MKKAAILFFVFLAGAFSASAYQQQTATFRFVQKMSADTQRAADRKLAAYLAPFAESRGYSGLCEISNGACAKNAKGETIYDLALVSAAIENIFETDITTAARARLRATKQDEAAVAAETEFAASEKPVKTP